MLSHIFLQVVKTCTARKNKTKQEKAIRVRNRLTVGKLMVRGRMIKGMTLNIVFMVRRLGLSKPDSAPNCRERNVKRTCPVSCHRLQTVCCLGDRPPWWGSWFLWRPRAECRKDPLLSGQETRDSLRSVGWAQAGKPSSSVQWKRRWRPVPEQTDKRLHLLSQRNNVLFAKVALSTRQKDSCRETLIVNLQLQIKCF